MSALSLAACSGPKQRPKIHDLDDAGDGTPSMSALRPLLDRRAAAVRAKDERAFLADLDPGNKALIERQRMIFGNLRQLRITNFTYVVDNPTAPPILGSSDPYLFGPIHEVVQLSADTGPGGVAPAATFRYGVARRDGKLVIADITALTKKNREELDLDGLPADAPWYLGPLTIAYTGNVCLLADSSVPDLSRYAGHAAAEARRVEQMWGDRPRFPGHVLALTNAEKTFGGWFGAGEPITDLPAFNGICRRVLGMTSDAFKQRWAGYVRKGS